MPSRHQERRVLLACVSRKTRCGGLRQQRSGQKTHSRFFRTSRYGCRGIPFVNSPLAARLAASTARLRVALCFRTPEYPELFRGRSGTSPPTGGSGFAIRPMVEHQTSDWRGGAGAAAVEATRPRCDPPVPAGFASDSFLHLKLSCFGSGTYDGDGNGTSRTLCTG